MKNMRYYRTYYFVLRKIKANNFDECLDIGNKI